MARYIITDADKITRTDTYLVKVECADGGCFEELEPRRLFPHTNLNQYVTLLDSSEKEIAMIKDLATIAPDSRQAIEDCFFDYYMIPEITEILHVEDKFGVLKWRVMTDRGEIEFSIRNRHSDIKLLGKKRLLVRDSNDNRYQVCDIANLSKSSIKKIYSYL
jgi:hypothetical protein